jgi:hypothetical protein
MVAVDRSIPAQEKLACFFFFNGWLQASNLHKGEGFKVIASASKLPCINKGLTYMYYTSQELIFNTYVTDFTLLFHSP